MAKGWKCARCSTQNPETRITCTNCNLIRGSVVVPSSMGASTGWGAEANASPPPMQQGEAQSGEAQLGEAQPGEAQSGEAQSGEAQSGEAQLGEDQPGDERPVEGSTGGWVQPQPIEGPGVATAQATPLWQRIPGWLVVVVLIGAGAIGGLIFNASRAPTGEITRSGNLTAADLRIGDCFDLKDPTAEEVDEVTAGPCTSEHEFEMFFVGSLPEGDYPGADGFQDYVGNTCIPAFEDYIGTTYEASALDIFWLEPTVEAWEDGDRAVQCAAFHPRIHRLTETVKGSNQ